VLTPKHLFNSLTIKYLSDPILTQNFRDRLKLAKFEDGSDLVETLAINQANKITKKMVDAIANKFGINYVQV
jgi:hypothetical protein